MKEMEHKAEFLKVSNLRKSFRLRRSLPWQRSEESVKAVDGVTFEIQPHETFSLVGESGSGKTTIAKMILKLEKPTEGKIMFQGRDVNSLKGTDLRWYRDSVQAVFQDPWSSLNPRQRIRSIVTEPLVVRGKLRKAEINETLFQLMHAVGLGSEVANSFPHELSGGMRQRVAVARALATQPSLIILDEPVSALDVSIRAQIMNLLKDLQLQIGNAYLLIAHNLATVRYLSQRVAVVYLGQIVELASTEQLFGNPLHPYTKALISASTPSRPGENQDDIILSGEIPSPIHPPPGCRFHPRCPFAFEKCATVVPEKKELASGHSVSCHLY
jgi:oligopeptide/dipeptide ABC transporter ATP-binding protein